MIVIYQFYNSNIVRKLLFTIPLIAVFFILLTEAIEIEDNPAETTSFKGVITAWLVNEEGVTEAYRQTPNLVVTLGENTVSDLIFPDINFNANATDSKYDVLHIGTGSTAPVDANTGIETLIGGSCLRLRDATVTGTASTGGNGAEIMIQVDFLGNNCPGTITEAAAFNDLFDGEILARQTFAGLAVGAGDTLTVQYNFTINDDGI